jgi:hypothetical protein
MGRKFDVFSIATVATHSDHSGSAGILTQRFQIAQTPTAMPAIQVSIGGNRVADGNVGDAAADLDDLASNFMTDDAGKLDGPPSGFYMLNGQPGAARQDTSDGFAGSGNWIGNLTQLEWRVRPRENKCFH